MGRALCGYSDQMKMRIRLIYLLAVILKKKFQKAQLLMQATPAEMSSSTQLLEVEQPYSLLHLVTQRTCRRENQYLSPLPSWQCEGTLGKSCGVNQKGGHFRCREEDQYFSQ